MDTTHETQGITSTGTEKSRGDSEFSPGTQVVYGLHGRCSIKSIETRRIGGQNMRFYKLEKQRSALSRSTRPEPAIWLPVETARAKGLRAPMTESEAKQVLEILGNREYYFPVNEDWQAIQPRLEMTIQVEGAIGLAKVVSYLHILKRKHIVAPAPIAKFDDNVRRVLARELAELREEPIRAVEDRFDTWMRHKLLPDS